MTNVERSYIGDLRKKEEDLDRRIGALLEEKSAIKRDFFFMLLKFMKYGLFYFFGFSKTK